MDAASPAPKAPLFEAVIVPHRSLSPRGVRRLILAIGVLCGFTALRFWLIGAWPVAGFAVLEIGLAAFLIDLNARRARASEVLILAEDGMRVIRTDMKGVRVERHLPAGWLNVSFTELPGRVSALHLVAHGVREEIGRSLGEEEKRSLAEALTAALRNFRSPRFDNPQLRD